jgi:hypothetical protein
MRLSEFAKKRNRCGSGVVLLRCGRLLCEVGEGIIGEPGLLSFSFEEPKGFFGITRFREILRVYLTKLSVFHPSHRESGQLRGMLSYRIDFGQSRPG